MGALAAAGVVLLGRVAAVDEGRIALADDLHDHLAHGDASLATFEQRCDAMDAAHGWSDFGWIDVPVFGRSPGARRRPVHRRGVSPVRGLYFLGLPWLHKWKSAFLFGADEDAEHIAHCIAADGRRR